MHSRRASYPSAKCPQLASAPARERRSSTRSSAAASSRSRRTAAAYQRAAVSGARWAVASAASRSVATACGSPFRPARSMWWARVGGSAAAQGQSSCAPFVGTQQPSGRSRLVDRPSQERVPEAEAAGYVGLPDQGGRQELVEGRECDLLGRPGCRGRQLRLERITDHRGSPQHDLRAVRDSSQLSGQRRRHGRGDAETGRQSLHDVRPVDGKAATGPCQLLEVERVAAALVVEQGGDRIVDRGSEELVGLGTCQRADPDADEGPRPAPRARALTPAASGPGPGGVPAPAARGIPVGGGAVLRRARRRPGLPSAGHRGSARVVWPSSVAPGATGRRDACDSARGWLTSSYAW